MPPGAARRPAPASHILPWRAVWLPGGCGSHPAAVVGECGAAPPAQLKQGKRCRLRRGLTAERKAGVPLGMGTALR